MFNPSKEALHFTGIRENQQVSPSRHDINSKKITDQIIKIWMQKDQPVSEEKKVSDHNRVKKKKIRVKIRLNLVIVELSQTELSGNQFIDRFRLKINVM